MPPRVYDVTVRYVSPRAPSKLSRVILHANAAEESVAIKRSMSALKGEERRRIEHVSIAACPGALDGCLLVGRPKV